MKRDIKYIIKRVVIGLILGIIFMNLNKCDVHAAVILDGTSLTSSNYKVLAQGNRTLKFGNSLISTDEKDFQQYFNIALCSDVSNISSWYSLTTTGGINYINNVDIFVTNYSCKFPNSNYSGGHVVYVYGRFNTDTSCSSSYTNCYSSSGKDGIVFYNPSQTSYALLSQSYSVEPFEMDYSSQSIINTTNSVKIAINDVISKTNQIIQQNMNTFSMQQNESNQTQEKLDDINDSINNKNVDDPSELNSIKDKVASNNVISDLVLLPVTLFSKVLDSLNGSCSTYSLGSLYNHDITFPCIDVGSYIGNVLWGVIDVLISGLLIYAISRKFVKVFNELSSLKEGDIID